MATKNRAWKGTKSGVFGSRTGIEASTMAVFNRVIHPANYFALRDRTKFVFRCLSDIRQ
jgi:hypothetical protein